MKTCKYSFSCIGFDMDSSQELEMCIHLASVNVKLWTLDFQFFAIFYYMHHQCSHVTEKQS